MTQIPTSEGSEANVVALRASEEASDNPTPPSPPAPKEKRTPHEAKGSRHGGHLEDFPEPRERKFDGPPEEWPEPRRLSVSGGVFSIGIHWWMRIREEDNPIWDPKEEYWVRPWYDDHIGDGRLVSSPPLPTEAAAKAWVARTIRTEFNNGVGYEIDDPDKYYRAPKAYRREGD